MERTLSHVRHSVFETKLGRFSFLKDGPGGGGARRWPPPKKTEEEEMPIYPRTVQSPNLAPFVQLEP